ncbi:hypothetical protein GOV11_04280 [Candidatus Woesearchaeota archaeon]|nr:hypothetical protein [Candidatus Woesearchaeota archaeon]
MRSCACNDGLVFANAKSLNECCTVFYCTVCQAGSFKREKYTFDDNGLPGGIKPWDLRAEKYYVSEHQDAFLAKWWIIEQFENDQTNSDEFKRRIGIWGREVFERVWKEYKRLKELNNDKAH